MEKILKLPESLVSDGEKKWNAFVKTAREKGVRISGKSKFIRDAVSVFALSDFVYKSLSRAPDILNDLIQKGDLDRSYSEDAYKTGIADTLSNMGDAGNERGIFY